MALPDSVLAERAGYIASLQSITPADPLEAADLAQAIGWLRTAHAVHKPRNMDEHLGVLVVVLSPDRRRTFLLNHRKAQLWLPPGGHVDEGLTLSQAAQLEVLEELGQDLPLLSPNPFFLTRVLTGGLNAGHIDVTAWFIAEGDPQVRYAIFEKEATEAGWFPLTALATLPEASNLPRAYRKIRALFESSG